ncbi:ABC transporter permease [Pseudarthrobacter sp. NPDC058196]|uniref:ABC transporter permease n=1 Tax=Pseudarthrobacter sp. NPDC058196 TaxID=3346376 RepID=UPI0036DF69B2
MSIVRRVGYLLALPLILIAVWWIVTAQSPSLYFPGPRSIGEQFVKTWIGPRFLTEVLPSLARFLLGVILAIIIGTVSGVVIGSVRWLRKFTEPGLEFFRAIPPPILLPILMIVLGINDTMRIAVIVTGCIWPVLLNTVEGVRAVDSVLAETARTYGIGGAARIRYLVVPSAAPQIMAGIRQCLSVGLILMIISEMFAASSGLGFSIVKFQRTFAIPQMWSGILVLGLIGVAVAFLFQFLERRVLRWYNGLKDTQNAA